MVSGTDSWDDAMLESLGNSLFLGVVSCLVSAVIGTLGQLAYPGFTGNKGNSGIYFYIAVDDTRDHTWVWY